MEEGFAEDIFLILAGNELAVYGFTSRSALLTQLDWSVLPLHPLDHSITSRLDVVGDILDTLFLTTLTSAVYANSSSQQL